MNVLFWPMVHRRKKCTDISELTSGGRAEIENVKNDMLPVLQFNLCQQMLHFKCYCTSMEHRAKKLFVGFWKHGSLAKLMAKRSRGCRFSLFLHHNYQVSLRSLDTYAAKRQTPLTPYFLTIQLSSVLGQRVHRWTDCADIWKVTSSGRVDIENKASDGIFNFITATMVHFWTLSHFTNLLKLQ